MDIVQWAQEMGAMEDSRHMVEKRARPQKDLALNCPRCNSTNTKFCYYNNYSFSQPRYFCKTCRRYWTEGGSLRNVPVGGCSRKNKRTSSSSKKLPDQSNPPIFSDQSASQNPKIHEGHDLNLAYLSNPQNPNSSSTSSHLSSMEVSRGLSSFMQMPVSDSNTAYSSGFSLQGFKPDLNFSLDGYDGGLQGVQESGARLFFSN